MVARPVPADRIRPALHERRLTMGLFANPFDPKRRLACGCGRHASLAEHQAALAADAPAEAAAAMPELVRSAVMRAVFPDDARRRAFLQSAGAATALAALDSVFPLGAPTGLAQDRLPPEKESPKIGIIPISRAF